MVVYVLLGISIILFFGLFAEYLFKKLKIPDLLFLIFLGILIGPILSWVTPQGLAPYTELFTTLTLMFLLFEGAFHLDLKSVAHGFSSSLKLTVYNFFISAISLCLFLYALKFTGLSFLADLTFLQALFFGFALGGISSAFVIPMLQSIKIRKETRSILTLESALTDVFCIVFALATIQLMKTGEFTLATVLQSIASLFAIAGLIGVLGGIIWMSIAPKVADNKYMLSTIAFLFFVYALTEYLGGNGAISVLFMGIILNNAKELVNIATVATSNQKAQKAKAAKGLLGEDVIEEDEQILYNQIAFFLKTLFFVYIGLLMDFSDWYIVTLGCVIGVLLLFARKAAHFITKKYDPASKELIETFFARGLAAAAIVQIALLEFDAPIFITIGRLVYTVITATIILNSVTIFMFKKKNPEV